MSVGPTVGQLHRTQAMSLDEEATRLEMIAKRLRVHADLLRREASIADGLTSATS